MHSYTFAHVQCIIISHSYLNLKVLLCSHSSTPNRSLIVLLREGGATVGADCVYKMEPCAFPLSLIKHTLSCVQVILVRSKLREYI